jgi:glycosyltransferase involved in cell wall biosynthesis
MMQALPIGSVPKVSATASSIRSIGIVVVGDETYGVQRFVCSFIQALREFRIGVVVIAMEPGPMLDACVAAGAEGAVCSAGQPPDFGGIGDAARVARYTVACVRRLTNVLRDVRVDAVLVRTSYLVALVAAAARLSGTASFWLLPNLVSDRYPLKINKLAYDLLMGACGMLPIANSSRTRASLANLIAPARIAHLGINPDEFDPQAVEPLSRQKLGLSDTDVVVGVFARLVPFKGQRLLIEAMAARKDSYPDLKLLLCGGPTDGAYYQELLRTIGDNGLEGRVLLVGQITDAQRYYGLCDIVASVRMDPEPFGLSVIEGMLMEKPVLVHASGGPAETVVDRQTGWHIRSATRDDFIAGLDAVFADRAHWASMGSNARRHALANYTHRDAARRILAIIEERTGGAR